MPFIPDQDEQPQFQSAPSGFIPDPEPVKPKQSFLGGVFKGAKEKINSTAGKFGSLLGEAAALVSPETQRLRKEAQATQEFQSQKDREIAQMLIQRGETEKAKKFLQSSLTQDVNRGTAYGEQAKEYGQKGKELFRSAAETALLATGAPAMTLGGALVGSGFSGAVEGARQLASGEGLDMGRIGEAVGSGAVSTAQARGLTRFTNPLTDRAMQSVGANIASPIASRFARAVTGGVANTAEDVAFSAATGSQANIPLSFGLGAITGGMGSVGGQTRSLADQALNPTNAKAFTPSDLAPSKVLGAADTGLSTAISAPFKAGKAVLDVTGKGASMIGSGIKGGAEKFAETKTGETLLSPFTKGSEMAKGLGKKVAGVDAGEATSRLATTLMKVDPGEYASNPERYEELAKNFARYTTKQNPREALKEFSTMSKNARAYIKDQLSELDAKIGGQSLEDVAGEVRQKLLENEQVAQYQRAYPQGFEDYISTITQKLDDGNGGTSLSKIDDLRVNANEGATTFYKNGRILTQDTAPQIESLYSSHTGKILKDMLTNPLSGVEGGDKIAQALNIQHTAMQVLPAVAEGEFSGQGAKGASFGKLIGNLADPLAKRGALNVVRQADPLSEGDLSFLEKLRSYSPSEKSKTLMSMDTPTRTTPVMNTQPPKVGDLTGTALDTSTLKESTTPVQQSTVTQPEPLVLSRNLRTGEDLANETLASRFVNGKDVIQPVPDSENVVLKERNKKRADSLEKDIKAGYRNTDGTLKKPEDFDPIGFAERDVRWAEEAVRSHPGEKFFEDALEKSKDLLKKAKQSSSGGINTNPRSVTTNIQARYAKESPKVGDGRRNISAEIIKRAIETKGGAQQKRIYADFPELKNVNSLNRSSQERIIRALDKKRYN